MFWKLFKRKINETEEYFKLFQTEAGRQKLGRQLAISIREQLDSTSLPRKLLIKDELEQGSILKYDVHDFGVSFDRNLKIFTTQQNEDTQLLYIIPVSYELFASAGIHINEIQKKRIAVVQRMQEKIFTQLKRREERDFIKLMNKVFTVNKKIKVIPKKESINVFLEKCIKDIFTCWASSIPCEENLSQFSKTLVMNGNTFDICQNVLPFDYSCLISSVIPSRQIYIIFDTLGMFTVRNDLILLPDATPKEAIIGYVGYENIVPVITHPNNAYKILI